LPNTIWALDRDHDTFENFDTALGEQRSDITRVLEVDDVWNLIVIPPVNPVESILPVRLLGVGHNPEHQRVVIRIAVLKERSKESSYAGSLRVYNSIYINED
jgi:hypothetical protein